MSSNPDSSQTRWQRTVGLTWQWQLSEPPVDTPIDADVYGIDIFDNNASVIGDLHQECCGSGQ